MKKRILCPDCQQDSLFLHEVRNEIFVKCQIYECFKMPLDEWKTKHKSYSHLSAQRRGDIKKNTNRDPISMTSNMSQDHELYGSKGLIKIPLNRWTGYI